MVGGKRYSGSNANCDDTEAKRSTAWPRSDEAAATPPQEARPTPTGRRGKPGEVGLASHGRGKGSLPGEVGRRLCHCSAGPAAAPATSGGAACGQGDAGPPDRARGALAGLTAIREARPTGRACRACPPKRGSAGLTCGRAAASSEVRNIIVAATDTLIVSTTWALSLLVNNRRVLKKAQQELDTHVDKSRHVEESDVKNLTYLQAIVKETLRLYPLAPLVSLRSSMEDCTFSGGFRIPAATSANVMNMSSVTMRQSLCTRDERVWSNPEEFEPERFLTAHANVDVRGQNFELIPFGAGRRSCAGTSLALHTMHLTLASLLQSFEINTVSDEPVDMTEGPGLTNLKTTPLEVLLIPRLDQKVYERD
ncbi:hypothetical protein NL676_023009 [Syzygium grande]|nr:hypothetical protein NL676_023009 [Syzygium grande]